MSQSATEAAAKPDEVQDKVEETSPAEAGEKRKAEDEGKAEDKK